MPTHDDGQAFPSPARALQSGGKIDAILSMRDVRKALVERFEADKAKRPVATLGDVVENSTLNEAPHGSSVGDVEGDAGEPHGSTVVPIDAGAAARGQAFGIFTERDFLHLLASETDGGRAWDAPAVEHMTAGGEPRMGRAELPAGRCAHADQREGFPQPSGRARA